MDATQGRGVFPQRQGSMHLRCAFGVNVDTSLAISWGHWLSASSGGPLYPDRTAKGRRPALPSARVDVPCSARVRGRIHPHARPRLLVRIQLPHASNMQHNEGASTHTDTVSRAWSQLSGGPRGRKDSVLAGTEVSAVSIRGVGTPAWAPLGRLVANRQNKGHTGPSREAWVGMLAWDPAVPRKAGGERQRRPCLREQERACRVSLSARAPSFPEAPGSRTRRRGEKPPCPSCRQDGCGLSAFH